MPPTTSPKRSRSRRAAAVLAAAALAASPAAAGDGGDPSVARRLIERAAELLEEASAARIPPRRPPTPIAVTWKARRLGPVDLGAPLVALASGDLDGDGRAELIAVTEREVVVLAPQGTRALTPVARLALPDDASSSAPRTPVATAVVVPGARGAELRVRSSTRGRGARYRYADGKLRELGALEAYPLCADRDGRLARGRAYFERSGGRDGLPEAWPARYWAAACRTGLVDRDGRALKVDAVLAARGALAVTVTVRCDPGEDGCVAERQLAVSGVGVAVAIADVDRDGRPEVITSAASAPDDPDAVTVYTLPATGTKLGKPVFKKKFSGGVVGVAADDLDGDGDIEVIAAVRLAGARKKVDLWLLD
jgi:hypothetical protein